MALRSIARWLVLLPLALNALTGPYLVMSATNGDERIVGVLLTAFCVLAIVVAEAQRRRPDRLLRGGLWAVPAAFACTAVVMIAGGASGLGGYYAALATATAVGVALAP